MKRFKSIIPIYAAVFAVLLWQGCKPKVDGPAIPELGYSSYSKIKSEAGKDSMVIVHLTFRDGGGDIGLTDADSFPPFQYGSRYFYNLPVDFYSIENGIAAKVRSTLLVNDTIYKDTVNYSQRITDLTPKGVDKSIKGKIDVLSPFSILDPTMPKPDSVYYEISLFDRQLNQSNIVRTPVIVLNL